MDFPTLLKLTASEADRKQWMDLAVSYQEAQKRVASGGSEAQRASDQVIEVAAKHLQHAFRAIRHPLPSRDELKKMLANAQVKT